MPNGVGCVGKALGQSPWEAKDITLQQTDTIRPRFTLRGSFHQRAGLGDHIFRGESDDRHVRHHPAGPPVVAEVEPQKLESPRPKCQERGPWREPHTDTYSLQLLFSVCLLVTWRKRKQTGCHQNVVEVTISASLNFVQVQMCGHRRCFNEKLTE